MENGNVEGTDNDEPIEAAGSTTGGELTAVKVNNEIARKRRLGDNDKPNFDGLIKICK